jgi:hypothetical protein
VVDSGDPRRRAHAELTAAGVPPWAQQAALEGSTVARYYAWVDDGLIDGRLLLPPGTDEAAAIGDLLRQGNELLSTDESDRPTGASDLGRPCALLILRPHGFAHGGCPPRPDTDLLPLERLIRHAVDALGTLGEATDAQE